MFEAIANHLWQSTLFALLIAVLCYFLRQDGAHIRYWLWLTASVKFLVPFSLLASVGSWLSAWATVSEVPEAWTNTFTVVARPFAPEAANWSAGTILVAAWLLGTLLFGSIWLLRAARLRKLVADARPDPEPLIDGRRQISVLRSEARIEPGVVGILNSALLLPAGLEQRLNASQLDAVLTHELCHIRRRDNLTAAVQMLVEAAFWFHPLIWWIGAKLVDERERACDEMVVALGHDRETYAESILDVCALYAATPLRCAAGISGSDLKRRITQIMRYQGMKNLKVIKKFVLSVAAIAALAVPMLTGLLGSDSAFAQEENVPAPPLPPQQNFERPRPPIGTEEYLPIVKVAPIYPPRAAARGIEGYVVVQYTVNETGSTEDVTVIDSSTALFESAAIESARKYKYKPRIVNNTPVEVAGVTTRIVFELAGDVIERVPAPAAPAAGSGGGADDVVTVTIDN